jgi:O-antigen ligase
MKQLFVINDTLSNKLSYYHLIFFLITLPFDRFYSQLVLISFLIHTIIHLKKSSFQHLPLKKILIVQSVFWLTVVGMLYSKNISHAGSMLSRQLAIFILPLLFFLTQLDLKKYSGHLLKIFSLTCTAVVLYLYVDAFRIISYSNLPFRSITTPAFLNHNFSSPIGLHATYLSLYIALSLIFLMTILFRPNAKAARILIVLQMLFLFVGLIQLGSRTIFFTALLFIGFVFPILYLRGRTRRKYIVYSLAILLVTGFFIFQIAGLKGRFLNDLSVDLGAQSRSSTFDDPRVERWKLAVGIIKQSPVFGHGSGDELDLLKDSYFQHKLYTSYLFSLNAHNEYLSILIKNGIIGLLVYLFTLGYGFFVAWQKRDIVFTGFLLLITMLSFSENFLDVNKGIFFYAFFFSFFLRCPDQKLNE